jgi:hypothetical protein
MITDAETAETETAEITETGGIKFRDFGFRVETNISLFETQRILQRTQS